MARRFIATEWPVTNGEIYYLLCAVQPGMKPGDIIGHEIMGMLFYICINLMQSSCLLQSGAAVPSMLLQA